jgi:hypothetical protein
MTTSFQQYVAQEGFDADSIQHAMRCYLAEITEDHPPELLRADLERAAGDSRAVAAALEALESDSRVVEAASMALFSDAWQDPQERARIQAALAEAKDSLPIVEVGIAAVVALYALYLHHTRGLKRERIEEEGSRRVVVREYYPPDGPLAAVVRLFRS